MKTNITSRNIFRFSHDAMSTFNHIDIHHSSESYARQASQEAFREMDRLEALLSSFREGSDIWQLNHSPAHQKVLVASETYDCLYQSKQLSQLTNGWFDITLGQLSELWKSISHPTQDEIESIKENTGIHFLQISEDDYSVTKLKDGLIVDLGGVGKGYIIDRMAETLEEWDVDSALINSGGSSILALEPPPESDGWLVTCGNTTVRLSQGAVSGSGMAVKGNHIIAPHSGRPIPDRPTQWSMAPTATIADAISTASMIMTESDKQSFINDLPNEIRLISSS